MVYEYLIYWLEAEPDLGKEYYSVVRPNSVTSEHDVKNGVSGLRLAEGEFSFSWEMPGLQVVFVPKDKVNPPSHDKVTGWVQEICENIMRASGLPAKVLIEDDEVWAL